MKERLQNITQNLSRKRIITILLVCALIVTSIPFGVLGGNTALAAVGSNYGAVIGNTASFNTKNFPDALITDDPANFDMDSWEDVGDENNRIDFGDEDSLEGAASSFSKLPLVITNYYVDEEGHNLWYEVEAAPGYNTPSKLEAKPWVYQNDLRNYDDTGVTTGMPDALLINQTGATYVFDEEGNRISELDFYAYEAHKLSAGTTLQGSVDYQWQIYSDDEWINIVEGTDKDFRLSFAMILSVLDDNLTTKVRVVTTSGSKSLTSDPVAINFVIPSAGGETTTSFSLRSNMESNEQLLMATSRAIAASEVEDTVTVTVKYIYAKNGNPVAKDEEYTIVKGEYLSQPVPIPVVEGYDAYLGDETENPRTTYTVDWPITEDTEIIFKYRPAKVNYTIAYYLQNVNDDEYELVESEEKQGFTGDMTEVGYRAYDGFVRLDYQPVEIASDGSTIVEVYYDRLYYKMTFNLDGGYGVQPIYARYGAPVKVSNPTKAGYAFVGWDYLGQQSSDNMGDGNADQLPTTVPAQHTAYKAVWKATDAAKVTIVYWGENANDEDYSYIESQEIYAAPGTELKYGMDDPICGLKPHKHGDGDCIYKCILDEHTHSVEDGCYKLVCEENTHNHVTSGCTLECTHQHEWYCTLFGCSHTHTDECYTCGKTSENHTHSLANGCYELICTETVHSHDASCYSCVQHTHNDNCYLNGADIETDKYTYVKSDTVTVAADGSTVMNVYYDRVSYNVEFHRNQSCTDEYTSLRITAKWGENILSEWPTYNGSSSWLVQGKSSTWQNSIQVMPIGGAKFWGPKTGSGSYTAYYYVEALPGATDTTTHNGVKYILHHKDVSVSSGTVTDEERYRIEGFTYKEGTSNGTSYSNAKFYYTRNSYELVFNDGKDDIKTEMVKYEAGLGSYAFTPEAPDLYEPGSVKFDGWYLNPECTGDEYVLSEHTMPADNVLLYAKWAPVTHKVRFFLDQDAMENGTVYVGGDDGKTEFEFDIQHGSLITQVNKEYKPTKGKYDFVGWFYIDKEGNEQMWDFDSTTVTGPTDIYGKWSSKTLVTYTVRFVYVDENGNEIAEIADPITGTALGGTSKTFEAKPSEQLKEQYREGYFSMTASHTIVMDIENEENNTFTFQYKYAGTVPYTVYYVTTGKNDVAGSEKVTINGVDYYTVAETLVKSDNKKAVVTESYKYVKGYIPTPFQQTLVIDPVNTENNVIIFVYNKDEENDIYTVHYMIQNVDGNGYTEHSIYEGVGKVGETVTATHREIANFTYVRGSNGTDTVAAPALPSGKVVSAETDGTVDPNSLLNLYLYYDRNSYDYKVQYLEQGTNKVLHPQKDGEGLWESLVTERYEPIEGYDCVSLEEQTIQIQDNSKLTNINTITFYYVEKKSALTIIKSYEDRAAASIDENQTFIFNVAGADAKTNDINLTVTIHVDPLTGTGQVKLTDLPAGKYIVTENEDWSWRYDVKDDKTVQEVTLERGIAGSVTFVNQRKEIYWLDGDSYEVNIFKGELQQGGGSVDE